MPRGNRPLRLLVVDDRDQLRQLVADLLAADERFGDAVLQARNGAEAIDVAARGRPDAVLLDNSMPILDGIDALPELRRLLPHGLIDRRLHLAAHGANSGAKALSVIGSLLTGGDSIDDVAVLRSGAAGSLFDGTRAPSTVGSWLRAHKWSNVRQLDAVSRELLARLWAVGAGPADVSAPLTIDLDSTIVEVHGRKKQGAAFGYTKVRGYHPQLATCAQTGQVLMCRLRGGSAGAARGASSFLTETISRARNAGATGQLTVRADSAFYSRTVLATAAKFDVRFSITARQDKRVRAAIDAIPESAWQPIPYWLSTPEISGADIAETRSPFSPATSGTPAPSDSWSAGSARRPARSWRCSPPGTTTRSSPTATSRWPKSRPTTAATPSSSRPSPSSRAPAWPTCPRATSWPTPPGLALAVMAHNLGRAVGQLAGPDLERATAATLRRAVFTMPGRLVHTGRRRHLRLPANWPWADPVLQALTRITAIPLRC
jgi:CheY-like chemotaxis protein